MLSKNEVTLRDQLLNNTTTTGKVPQNPHRICVLSSFYFFMSVYSIVIRVSLQKGSFSCRSSVHFLISERVSEIRMSVSREKFTYFLCSLHTHRPTLKAVIFCNKTDFRNICTYHDASHTLQIFSIGNDWNPHHNGKNNVLFSTS